MADDIFKAPLSLLLGFVKSFLYDKVCYLVGWFFLRIITIGNYPSEGLSEGLWDSRGNSLNPFDDDTGACASLVGMLILVAVGALFFKLTH